MVKQKHDKTESAKPVERLKWILISQYISYIICQDIRSAAKY